MFVHRCIKWLIYRPRRKRSTERTGTTEKAEELYITATDGVKTVSYLFSAREGAEEKETIVFMHGVSDCTEDRQKDAVRMVRKTGKSVFVVGYRGFCKGSREWPDRKGIVLDAAASVAALRRKTSGRIIFHGQSLGTSVALHVALQEVPDGLILENPFLSLKAVLTHKAGVLGSFFHFLAGERWDSIDVVEENKSVFERANVLFLVSGSDTLVSPSNSEVLIKALRSHGADVTCCVFRGAAHETLYKHESYFEEIKKYCEQAPGGKQASV
ncbi:MAG: BEM46 family protein [Amphiamblys sp. WSBS2006]|nr:MAG: BEM46 family protein [Amphiamblys sp. WSBS2006]